MSYILQYQAHVDDLTSLAGSPEDTSWLIQQPHEAPLRRALPSLGQSVGDYTSGVAVVTDDGSAFIQASDPPLEAQGLPALGISVGDYDSAAANPADVSWLTSYPDIAPEAEAGPTLGWFSGDLSSGAAAIPADDGSWFFQQPRQILLRPEMPAVGYDVVDLDPVYGFVGWPFEYVADEHIGYDPTFLAYLRATTGTGYARLYDLTAGAAVAGSEVSTTESLLTLIQSGSIILVDGHEYQPQGYRKDLDVDAGGIKGAGVKMTRTLEAGV